MNRSLDVVYNCCKLPLNHKYYEDAKAVDVLVKIRDKTSHLQNETDITSLLTLGYLLDDSNNNRITSGQGRRPILQLDIHNLVFLDSPVSSFQSFQMLVKMTNGK